MQEEQGEKNLFSNPFPAGMRAGLAQPKVVKKKPPLASLPAEVCPKRKKCF
jgi:hypothetical protein